MTDHAKNTLPGEKLGYDAAVARTEEEIRRLLTEAPPAIRRMTGHLAKATGKLLRARALLACATQSDSSVSSGAVQAVAAVELLHLATLVHDDIIDSADKRRGIAALHQKFGEKYAVLCGDYLFCLALELAAAIPAPQGAEDSLGRAFPSYLTEICLGELRQNQNNHNYRLSEPEYFRIIRGKTAALFETCFYAGFVLAEEPDSLKEVYTEIGHNIGIIFQLRDDCADYANTRKVMKKPVLSDYSQGVVTLPLIYALRKDKSLLPRIKAGLGPAALKAAVAAAGGLAYTQAKIDSFYEKTRGLLETLDAAADKEKLLAGLLCQAAGRPLA